VLKISQKLEYSMRAMIELALHESSGELVPAREIAEAQQIPLRFLEQQLGTLHKAGLVESQRGAGGGCRLAKPAVEIRAADIADAIEGGSYPMSCLDPGDHECFFDEKCGLQGLWGDIQIAIRRVFEETNLADMAKRHQKLGGPVLIAPSELIRSN
jgi:Rrf2 family protein